MKAPLWDVRDKCFMNMMSGSRLFVAWDEGEDALLSDLLQKPDGVKYESYANISNGPESSTIPTPRTAG